MQAPTLSAAGELGERAAVTSAGGSYLDLSPFLCARGECPTMVGHDLVYRDDNHLTTTFVSWLTPLFDLEVAQLRASDRQPLSVAEARRLGRLAATAQAAVPPGSWWRWPAIQR